MTRGGFDRTAGAPAAQGGARDTTWDEGAGPVLTSPDGTAYRLVVADDGTVSTVDTSLVVTDTFTRTNETPLSTADTGQAWVAFTGTGLSVVSNQCAKVTAGTQGSVIDADLADCEVSVDVVSNPQDSTSDNVLLRAADANNYLALRLSTGALIQVVAGATTTLGTLSGGAPLDGQTIAVRLNGTAVQVFRDGVSGLSVTTTLTTGDRHGLRVGTPDPLVFDNFTVRAL